MRILIVSDVFPPVCGGSGWSAFYLAKALAERGHELRVVKLARGFGGIRQSAYFGLPVMTFGTGGRAYSRLGSPLREDLVYWKLRRLLNVVIDSRGVDLVHGQHVLTIPPSVSAARQAGVPSVGTVRDYWPVCLFGSSLSGNSLCLDCSPAALARCTPDRLGAKRHALPITWPYVAHLMRRRAESLTGCSKVIAVSEYVRGVVTQVVPDGKVTVVPNLVDVDELQAIASESPRIPVKEPFLLYVGKLERNKGVEILIDILHQAQPCPDTLIVGDGALRAQMEAACRRSNIAARFLGWIDHDETLRLMARANALIFPSLWPEPLSRVLLEAMAVGAVVVAQPTGGTPEIIQDRLNGLLAEDAPGMVAGLRDVVSDAALRSRLRDAARHVASTRYEKTVVASRMERLYGEAAHGIAGRPFANPFGTSWLRLEGRGR